MEDDETLFERRITVLGLSPTLLPDATIRASIALDDTLAASTIAPSLKHISIDQQVELSAREPANTPDLAFIRTIGEGGMGRVHLARQRSLDREVAVKTLKDDASPTAIAALFREARLTGSLEHPGVVSVHALGIDDHGGPVLVMKRVEGVDWATLLADDAHPLWELLTANVDRLAGNLAILTQVCRTVEFAHSRGIIHRDIKPENVMVGSYGEVYLVDWGIAAAMTDSRKTDRIAGTPAYMAPEMFLGEPLDERTDVYLLGATLHEVLTGGCRHEGQDLMQVLRSALASEPVAYDASVPELLGKLCNAATTRDPARRPPNVRSFRDAMTEFLQSRSAMALSDAAAERLAQLHALLEGAKDGGAPSDLASAYRLATEARFGFNQSLREHARNAAASAGVRSSVLALVELELRQQHADTAEALLREVEQPDPALAQRVAAVRARDEARRREALRLEAVARDLDPSLQVLPRLLALGLLVAFTGMLSPLLLASDATLTPWRVAAYGVACIILIVLGTVLFRERLLANAYNRKLVGMMIGGGVVLTVERIVAAVYDVAVQWTFAGNLWLATMAFINAAVAIDSRLWLAVPPVLVGAVLTPMFPAWASAIFGLATTLSIVFTAFALWLTARRSPPPPGRR
jgi:eukaryotic-like serine/threonine-protein kinase